MIGPPDSVARLVDEFAGGRERYTHPDYNETQLRVEFINPLFEALGWDPRDSAQVSHEDRVMVDGKPKRPDYGFHIERRTQFYLETKKPALNLRDNPEPAYQLRRYGWSGNLAISALSDFEEFIVYDCRIQPQQGDPASKARLRYYEFSDYVDKWEEFAGLFSREAVANGALRNWVEDEKIRGATSVDQAFLREMEGWRATIAQDMALHNPQLSQRELNLLVQRTIDRIVFLRIAEDRNIENYGRLRRASSEGKQVYEELKRLFIEADDKYNSGLFHFGAHPKSLPGGSVSTRPQDEGGTSKQVNSASLFMGEGARGWGSGDPDTLSLHIQLSDAPLRHIIKQACIIPFSPYEFSVLPAEILGQVYERFLGKVIELGSGGAVPASIDKPEVRKAGGVYYTPALISSITSCENTVGDLLWKAKRPPRTRKNCASSIPACGSGSFLSGAYQYLLDWHKAWYEAHPAQYRNRRRVTPAGMRLTTPEKRRILLNNIYGVDLDQNAVEVSKLSLLLKLLEGEDGGDAGGLQTAMFAAGGRILPDLSGNIKWGNSLIGSDFYSGQQLALFDEEALLRVKPFDWESAGGFAEVMRAGGFDAVIGNPPYIRIQTLDSEQRQYFNQNYVVATRSYDIYVLFVEQAYKLLRTTGRAGFILPNKFFTTDYGLGLRRLLAEKSLADRIVDFEDGQVFSQAGTYTSLLFMSHQGSLSPEYVALGGVFAERGNAGLAEALASPNLAFEPLQITSDATRWALMPGDGGKLLSRLLNKFPKFSHLDPHIFQGLITGAD